MSESHTDEETVSSGIDAEQPIFEAAEYADGTVTYPPHPVGPNGAERTGTVDLREHAARVITWTTSTATPPGVRQPNTLAIVEFEMGGDYDGPPVRAIGQVADRGGTAADDSLDGSPEGSADDSPDRSDGGDTFDVEIGDHVEPVYVDELRDPDAGIREPESQAWDGFRFRPIE